MLHVERQTSYKGNCAQTREENRVTGNVQPCVRMQSMRAPCPRSPSSIDSVPSGGPNTPCSAHSKARLELRSTVPHATQTRIHSHFYAIGSKHVAITYQDRMAVCRRRRNCVHLPNSKCTCRTLVVQQYNTDRGQALRLPSLHAGHPRDHPPRITAFAPYNRQTPPQLLPYHVPLLSNCDRQDAMRSSSIQCAVCHGDLSKGAGPATWRTAAAPAAATRPVAAPTAPTAPHQRPPL